MLGWLKRRPAKSEKAYWAREDSYPESWGSRAALAAAHISPGSSVLDIGCGRMQLKELLPAGCRYQPADMTQWTAEVLPVDLDKREFPPGNYDCITLLGVLEYLADPLFALESAAGSSRRLVTTYCHPQPGADIERRRRDGWINDLTEDDIRRLLTAAGWFIVHEEAIADGKKYRQRLYVCDLATAEPSAAADRN